METTIPLSLWWRTFPTETLRCPTLMDRTQQRAPSLWEGANVKAHSPPQLSQRPQRFSEDRLLL